MEVISTVASLAASLDAECAARNGKRECVGFVPTMGALHEGHLSLVARARAENRVVVVSVFVNPTQFNDPEDLRNYPRTPERDLEMLLEAGADYVFMPGAAEIYPEPDTRQFDLGQLDKVMEGATRPGHFNGVAQVVSRLFDIVKPAKAYFGQKDFQQIAVIKAMIHRLGMPVQIVECPIVREPDGLAMSSRNVLLTPQHRAAAPRIYEALQQAAGQSGTISVEELEKQTAALVEQEPLLKVIYFNIVDRETLEPAAEWNDGRAKQGCIAVQAGNVRLIDNITIQP